MTKQRITTILFTLVLGASMAFAGDGKGTEKINQSAQLVEISDNMTELVAGLVQLSASLEAMTTELEQSNDASTKESIDANLETVRQNISLMAMKLDQLPKVKNSSASDFEDFEDYLYGE